MIFLMANGVLGVQQSLQLFRDPSFDHKIPVSGMVLSEFDDIASVSQCGKSCFNRPECVSIFFNSATKQCIAAGDLADHQMVSAPGFQHYTTQSSEVNKWQKFGQSHYLLIKEGANLYQAQKKCKEHGSKLVELETLEESRFVTDIAIREKIDIMIGVTDAFKENEWVFLSSLEAVPFTQFSSGNPDNYNNQDCVCIAAFFDYQWDDFNCLNEQRFYVCERFVGF